MSDKPTYVITCPECQGALVERTNKANGSSFLGCENWPKCKFTMPVPMHVLLERAGAPRLPGM